MILQLSEEYNSIGIQLPVIRGIGIKVELFSKKQCLFIVFQVVGANSKFPLHPVNSAYKSRSSSGHCSYPVSEAKCNSEIRSVSAPPNNDIAPLASSSSVTCSQIYSRKREAQ